MMKEFYPVCDNLLPSERIALGLTGGFSGKCLATIGMPVADVRAVTTGEFRSPLKGEWYLSGAIPSAYRAPNNFRICFYIVKLVRVKTETKTVIIPTNKP